jgi:hypothetical protein
MILKVRAPQILGIIPAFGTNDSLLWPSGVIHCFPNILIRGRE